MNIIIILSFVIAAMGTMGFMWIKTLYKNNRALVNKLTIAVSMNVQMSNNITHYKEIIVKLNDKDMYDQKIKEEIEFANGNDLAILANSL